MPTRTTKQRVITVDTEAISLIFGRERQLMRLTGSNVIEAWIARGALLSEPGVAE
jgi:DNA-binding CsgD family transcriptional regulator